MFNQLRTIQELRASLSPQKSSQNSHSNSPKKEASKIPAKSPSKGSFHGDSSSLGSSSSYNDIHHKNNQGGPTRFELYQQNKFKRKLRTDLDEILDGQNDFFSKYSDKLQTSGTRNLVKVNDSSSSSDEEAEDYALSSLNPSPIKKNERYTANNNTKNNSNNTSADSTGSGADDNGGSIIDANQQIIAEGLKKGYPDKLVVEELDAKSKKLADEMLQIFKGASNKRSVFRDRIKNYANNHPSLMIRLGNLVEDNQLPSCGYYGLKGREYITSTLMVCIGPSLKKAQAQHKWMSKFKLDDLVITILAPEVMTRIIASEMGISYERALLVLDDSSDFGRVYYSTNNDHVQRTKDHVESSPEGKSGDQDQQEPPKKKPRNGFKRKLDKLNDGLDLSSSSESDS